MLTTYFSSLICNYVFGINRNNSLPSSYYLGLSTTQPTVLGTNVSEPSSGAGYSRIQISNLTTSTDGTTTNSSYLQFEESSDSWGTVSYFVIFDASIGGNLLMYGALSASRTVAQGEIINIAAQALDLSITSTDALSSASNS